VSEQGDSHRGAVSRVYSRYARSGRKQRAWAADNPGNAAIRSELLGRIRELAGAELAGDGKILDVGCGTGWFLRELAQSGINPGRLRGIDALPARVAAAREAAPGTEVELGDAERLGFPDGGFSVVVQLTVLSSLGSREAIRKALGEGMRMLAPGGSLLIYEPRVPNPFNRHTILVRDGDLDAAGASPREQSTLTLLPALARRLGGRTQARYERLARLPLLRTHRLIVYRRT
jgi:ubiquinone/menaquinone biosynthesis C-methylase UbiE